MDRFEAVAKVVERMRHCLLELDEYGLDIPAAHLCLAIEIAEQSCGTKQDLALERLDSCLIASVS